MNPHQVTRDFEKALCEYTGAPYAVATNSCTMALLLAAAWHIERMPKRLVRGAYKADLHDIGDPQMVVQQTLPMRPEIEIPKRTYVSVPQSIIHAGGWPTFRDQDWKGWYNLAPLPIVDSARWFSSNMYTHAYEAECFGVGLLGGGAPALNHFMVCVSFHWSKTLGIQQGGAILHDDPEADAWLRRARFDGRTEGIPPALDSFKQIGWHCYMSPEVAAEGLMRLSFLPERNAPLPNDDYPDLSTMEIFK